MDRVIRDYTPAPEPKTTFEFPNRKLDIALEALEQIATLYGNPTNPEDAVIIAREAKGIAQFALSRIKREG